MTIVLDHDHNGIDQQKPTCVISPSAMVSRSLILFPGKSRWSQRDSTVQRTVNLLNCIAANRLACLKSADVALTSTINDRRRLSQECGRARLFDYLCMITCASACVSVCVSVSVWLCVVLFVHASMCLCVGKLL